MSLRNGDCVELLSERKEVVGIGRVHDVSPDGRIDGIRHGENRTAVFVLLSLGHFELQFLTSMYEYLDQVHHRVVIWKKADLRCMDSNLRRPDDGLPSLLEANNAVPRQLFDTVPLSPTYVVQLAPPEQSRMTGHPGPLSEEQPTDFTQQKFWANQKCVLLHPSDHNAQLVHGTIKWVKP